MRILQVFWPSENGVYNCVSIFATKLRARGWPRAFTCFLGWTASRENVYTYELKRDLCLSETLSTSLKNLFVLRVEGRGALCSLLAGSIAALRYSRIAVEWFEAWTELSDNNSVQSLEQMGLQFCGSWRVAILGPPWVCTSEPWVG